METHIKHQDHWGHEKKVTRLTNGTIKATFKESDASLLSTCRAIQIVGVNPRCACLILITKPSRTPFWLSRLLTVVLLLLWIGWIWLSYVCHVVTTGLLCHKHAKSF